MYALQFDGSSQWAMSNSQPTIQGAWTLEGWFYMRNTVGGNGAQLWVNGSGGSGYTGIWIGGGSTHFYPRAGDGSSNQAQDNTGFVFPTGAWHHFALVCTGANGQLVSYLDAVEQSSVAIGNWTPILTGSGHPLVLANNSSLSTGYTPANMQEIRVWNAALPATIIQQWMNYRISGSHPYYSNLRVYWEINDGTGSTLSDSSGNGYAGVTQNSPVWITGTSLSTGTPSGSSANYAIQMNGSSQYAQSGSAPSFGGAFTVEGWFYMVSAPSGGGLLWTSMSTSGAYTGIWIGGGSTHFYPRAGDGSSNQAQDNTGFVFPTGAWHHFALVCTGASGTLTTYLDGVQKSSVSIGSWTPAIGSPIVLGAAYPIGYYVAAKYQEFRVWSAALSQSTIQNWMSKRVDGTHPNYSSLKLYWKINEDSGTVLGDSSTNSYVANLYSSPSWVAGYALDSQQYAYAKSDGITFAVTASRSSARNAGASISFSDATSKGTGFIRSDSLSFLTTQKRVAARGAPDSLSFSDSRQKGLNFKRGDSLLFSGTQGRAVVSDRSDSLVLSVTQKRGLSLGVGDSFSLAAAPSKDGTKIQVDSELFQELYSVLSAKGIMDAESFTEWVELLQGRYFNDALSYLTAEQREAIRNVVDALLENDSANRMIDIREADGFAFTEEAAMWLTLTVRDFMSESVQRRIYLRRKAKSSLTISDEATYTRVMPLLAFLPKVIKVLTTFKVKGGSLFGETLRKGGFKLVGEKFNGLFEQKSTGD